MKQYILIVLLLCACCYVACTKKATTTTVVPTIDTVKPVVIVKIDTVVPYYPHIDSLTGLYSDVSYYDITVSGRNSYGMAINIIRPDSSHIIFRSLIAISYYETSTSTYDLYFNDTFAYAGHSTYKSNMFTYLLTDSVRVTWQLFNMPPHDNVSYYDTVVAYYRNAH